MGEPLTAPLRVGMIGAGAISGQYLDTFARIRDEVELVAVADLDRGRSAAVASARGVRDLDVDELLDSSDIDLIVNLTLPAAHTDIAHRALAAGKHSYGEKPLALSTAQADPLLTAAWNTGLWLGCAPDTVLGTGIQSARAAVDAGTVGVPTAAIATMASPGHESWHPNPDFYYVEGGGPLLDMGPYYIHALVTLLGPIASVTGVSTRSRDARTIGSGPRAGARIPVEVDTHVTGILQHENGVASTLVMSFDTVATRSAPIEIHGTEGSLVVPDPNRFDGTPELRRLGSQEWEPLPVIAGFSGGGRGIGILDFARTPAGGTPRADAALAYHALEVMEQLLASARAGERRDVRSTVARPAPVPLETIRTGL